MTEKEVLGDLIVRSIALEIATQRGSLERKQTEKLCKTASAFVNLFSDISEAWQKLSKIQIVKEEIENSLEQELQSTANNWAACFVTQLCLVEMDTCNKVRRGKLDRRVAEKIQSGLELLKFKEKEVMEKYPEKEPLPPIEQRNSLLTDLALLKAVIV